MRYHRRWLFTPYIHERPGGPGCLVCRKEAALCDKEWRPGAKETRPDEQREGHALWVEPVFAVFARGTAQPPPGVEPIPLHTSHLSILGGGGSAPCGRRSVDPDFNPGYGGIQYIPEPEPRQGRRHGRGRARAVLWCPRWRPVHHPPLPMPLKGLENVKSRPSQPRIEIRGYAPAPARGASPQPPKDEDVCNGMG